MPSRKALELASGPKWLPPSRYFAEVGAWAFVAAHTRGPGTPNVTTGASAPVSVRSVLRLRLYNVSIDFSGQKSRLCATKDFKDTRRALSVIREDPRASVRAEVSDFVPL